jgi:hypothetical protein
MVCSLTLIHTRWSEPRFNGSSFLSFDTMQHFRSLIDNNAAKYFEISRYQWKKDPCVIQ